MKRKRILYFIANPHMTGAQAVFLNLVEEFDKKKVHPLVITSGEGSFTDILKKSGIQHFRLPSIMSSQIGKLRVALNYLPNLLRIIKIIRLEKPDLIHVFSSDGLTYMSLPARWQGKPLIWHPHMPFHRFPRHTRILQRLFAAARLDHVIFLNDYARKSFSSFPIPSWDIVPNAVNAEKFKGNGNKRSVGNRSFPRDHLLVGLVARVVPGKGHGEFIQAAKIVSGQVPEARFLIIGAPQSDGTFGAGLREMVTRLRLDSVVRFTGHLYPPEAFMPCLDVLALPSQSELQGMVLLEAMAAGVPVVASNLKPIREMLEDQKTGLLVPPGDVSSLAEAILRLLVNPDLRKSISGRAFEKVEKEHSVRKSAEKISRIYSRLNS